LTLPIEIFLITPYLKEETMDTWKAFERVGETGK
jgi:hypothetical protein